MSRAFVKEPAGGEEELPDRPVSEHPNFVTPQGLAQIEAALERAQAAHATARAADDRTAAARANRDLRYWAARRASAQLIRSPEDCEQVRFGCTVTIEREDGSRTRWRIVGEDEADPEHGTLAYVA